MTVVTVFVCEKFGAQIQLFLAFLYCQTQLKTKILIKMASFLFSTQRTLCLKTKLIFEKKEHLSILNTKQNTKDLSVSNIFGVCDGCLNDLIYSYCNPSPNPVLGSDENKSKILYLQSPYC